jgi:5,10-methylene-tetrahydrofolate dehydrogenase/methenyl tetrahydrofolate cyclohydrolase
MSGKILSGKELSTVIREEIKKEVEQMTREGNRPGLTTGRRKTLFLCLNS